MSVDVNTIEEFSGKQVILHLVEEDGLREVEGKVEAASAAGVAFKEKGQRDLKLVLPDAIEEIQLAPTKPKKAVQKKLKPIEEQHARQHLADRHGYTLEAVNGMSDANAFAEHESIDHTGLGHRHEADKAEESESGDSE